MQVKLESNIPVFCENEAKGESKDEAKCPRLPSFHLVGGICVIFIVALTLVIVFICTFTEILTQIKPTQ